MVLQTWLQPANDVSFVLTRFDEATERGETTGLVKQETREANIFTISVNIGPAEKVPSQKSH